MTAAPRYAVADGFTIRGEFFGGLVFDQRSGRVREINRTGMIAIEALLRNLDPVAQLHISFPSVPTEVLEHTAGTFISQVIDEGLLSDRVGSGRFIELDWEPRGSCLAAPRSVFWECTARCNVGTCVHCYSDATRTNDADPEWRRLIEECAEIGVFTLDIGGGEPLLRRDLAAAVNAANALGMRCNLATSLSLDQRAIDQMCDAVERWDRNTIQISLDGPDASTHDAIRRSKGLFDRVVRNIGLLTRRGIQFSVNCTVLPDVVSKAEACVETALRLGARSVRFVRVIPSGRARAAGLALSPDEYQKLCLALHELSERYRGRIRVMEDTGFDFLAEPREIALRRAPRLPWIAPHHMACAAGRTIAAITASGEVLACAYLRGDTLVAGNLSHSTLRTIWRNSPFLWNVREQRLAESDCSSCDLNGICLGGCRAAAYGATGRLDAGDPGCWRSRCAA